MPMLENQTEKKMELEIETGEASEDLPANVQRARHQDFIFLQARCSDPANLHTPGTPINL